MENFFSRYKNPLVLMAVLFIQVIALATQVKRAEDPRAASSGGTRLIRVWTVTAVTPFERALVATGHFIRNTWHNYIDLHDVRKQNLALQQEVARLKLEQVRLREDAHQAQRLQALLGFKERFIGKVLPAQVIATSGSEQSRVLSIDKGSHDGVRQDMPVITPDGIVGKIKEVFPLNSQVLMINDHESGAGVVLQNSRLQGVLRGTAGGGLDISGITADEKVEVGEPVVTSGGDRIFPRGVPVGTVTSVTPDPEKIPFVAVRVKSAADLNRLEEVLVVTEITDQIPALAEGSAPQRAADVLAERLPSVTKPDENAAKPATGAGQASAPAQGQTGPPGATPKKPIAPVAQKPEPNGEKKTLGPTPSTKKAGQSAAPAVSGTATAVKTVTPTPTPAATPRGPATSKVQTTSAPPNQVKKPKPQATPSPAATPPKPEVAGPASKQSPTPVAERPPR